MTIPGNGSCAYGTTEHQSKKGTYVETGTGLNWAGRDNMLVNPPACGGWASDTQWYSGRNNTC